MRLKWHDYTDHDKYPQPGPITVICGARGTKYVFGVNKDALLHEVFLTVNLNGQMVRQTICANVFDAKKKAQRIEDEKKAKKHE